MKGTVGLRNLRVDCRIGVPRNERQTAQQLALDVELETDIAAAVSSEAVEDTIDYDAIVAVVRQVAEARKYKLVEALAEELAQQLLVAFPSVIRLVLEVRKHSAALPADACFVRLERS